MLRDYQENVVQAVVNFLKYRSGHGYVTAPGGSGKSHMIAAVGERVSGRVLVLARSEKLLSQNRSKFSEAVQSEIGIYCAGLSLKQLDKRITIASAQSLAGQCMNDIAVILVDECDEISDDEESQYQTIFKDCGNPRVIGFTATPFRTGSGHISWGEEIINIPLAAIMNAGYLTPPTNKVGTTLDLSNIDVRIGEYVNSQLEEVYKDPALLALSVKKIKQWSAERNSCLIFTQSIAHADLLALAMEQNGMPTVTVTGDTDKEELGFILHDFEEGRIKYLLNVMLLTRGYDMPCVDMIAVVRATKSKRLWEQMLYRGTRLKEGKKDFLVLDLGNNFTTHGPLGSPHRGESKKERNTSTGKICPECEEFTPPLSRQCPTCAYEFPEIEERRVSHSGKEYTGDKMVYEASAGLETYEVTGVRYKEHKSRSGNKTIMVSYYCDYGKYGNVAEWLSPWSSNEWAQNNAWQFFKDRGVDLAPPISGYSADDLLFHAERLRTPTHITVEHGEFPRVKYYQWDIPTEQREELELDDSIPF